MTEQVDRRTFARRAVAAIGAAIGAVFGIPAAATMLDPALRSKQARWTPVGTLSTLKEAQPQRVTYEVAVGWEKREVPIYLIRTGQDVLALSAKCTHAGCRVRYADKTDQFKCPCHGGIFSSTGEVVDGPPPRPLDRLETRVSEGRVEIRV